MNYYVLSAIQDINCPISLVDEAILYANKEQVNSDFEHGFLPWYSYKTSENCELPKNGILVLKNNIKITFRNISNNIYIVDSRLKNILKNYIEADFIKVDLVNDKLEKISDLEYYLFRFNAFLNYNDVLNVEKSIYRFNEDFLVLEKIYFLNNVTSKIFKIKNIDTAQDTFFINEILKREIESVDYHGIRIINVSMAKWRDSDDFSFMFLGDEEVKEVVWPI